MGPGPGDHGRSGWWRLSPVAACVVQGRRNAPGGGPGDVEQKSHSDTHNNAPAPARPRRGVPRASRHKTLRGDLWRWRPRQPLHRPRAAASAPAHVPGTRLRSRWQQRLTVPAPPFSPGAGGKPAAAGRRGTRVAGLPPAAYGGCKDASAAWAAGVLAVGAGPGGRERPENLREHIEERTAIMRYDGKLPHAEAARLAWASFPLPGEER